MDQEKFKEYQKFFDEIFNTDTTKHIDIKNMKLLKGIYDYFGEDLYRPSPKYEKLRHEFIEISDKFEATMTEEQKLLCDKYYELSNRISAELEEQLFIFGYIVGSELKAEIEMVVVKKDDNK